MYSLEEIENKKIEKRKELIMLIKNKEKIEIEMVTLSRQILDLQIRKKDLSIPLEKAKSLEKQLRLEIKNLEEEFWSIKNI